MVLAVNNESLLATKALEGGKLPRDCSCALVVAKLSQYLLGVVNCNTFPDSCLDGSRVRAIIPDKVQAFRGAAS